MSKPIKVLALVMLGVVASCVCSAYAEDEEPVATERVETLNRVKVQLAFTNWVGTTQTNYSRLATNWVPDLAILALTNFQASHVRTYAGVCTVSWFRFRATNETDVVVTVNADAVSSVTNAHEVMVRYYSACSVWPSAEGSDLDIGDRCYLDPWTNENSIVFVRNNVLVQVHAYRDRLPEASCHDTNLYSVVGLARALDEQIRKISVGE
ncbi:MAG: hypothetical protein WCL44_15195 [bacterium]